MAGHEYHLKTMSTSALNVLSLFAYEVRMHFINYIRRNGDAKQLVQRHS